MKIKRLIELVAPDKLLSYGDKPQTETVTGDVVRCEYCNGEGGIKHYGNSTFLGSLSSEYFASGFAGAGWAIIRNLTTGNVAATFDELTVRKKMRIYELEVQKISATNGSLWVSDNCSGDLVEKIR